MCSALCLELPLSPEQILFFRAVSAALADRLVISGLPVQHRHQLQVRGGIDRHHLAHEAFVIFEAPINSLLLLLAVLVLDLLRVT
jgi:hypothetical protein